MSRYIDADEALRMIRNSKQDCPLVDDKKGIWDVAHNCAISCVEAIPTADVVEVVRCCNCKHREIVINSIIDEQRLFCTMLNNREVDFTDYCSYGERRE